MVVFDSYYKFRVIPETSNTYKIVPIVKMGNDLIFNRIFEKHKLLTFTKKPPVSDIEHYSCCMINYAHGLVSFLPVFFQSWVLKNEYGVIKHQGLEDAKLFRVCEDGIFEVFILKGEKANATNLLQIMHSGKLDNGMMEICTRLTQTLQSLTAKPYQNQNIIY